MSWHPLQGRAEALSAMASLSVSSAPAPWLSLKAKQDLGVSRQARATWLVQELLSISHTGRHQARPIFLGLVCSVSSPPVAPFTRCFLLYLSG